MVIKVNLNGVLELSPNRTGAWFTKVDGLATATFRTTSYLYSGRDGGQVSSQLKGQRLVTIPGGLDANTQDAHLALRSDLINAVATGNTDAYLDVYLSGGRVMRMYGAYEQPIMPIDSPLATDFQVTFIANDHRLMDFSGIGQNSILISKKVQAGARWLTGSGWRWLTGSGLRWNEGASALNAFNSGTTATNPIITIYGPQQNPVIRNTTTGEQIKVNITLGDTDEVVIDTYLKSTKLNGGNINALVETGSTYFKLQTGDNLIELTNDSASGGTALVEWYDTYLGV